MIACHISKNYYGEKKLIGKILLNQAGQSVAFQNSAHSDFIRFS